jgi:hypothetical protein
MSPKTFHFPRLRRARTARPESRPGITDPLILGRYLDDELKTYTLLYLFGRGADKQRAD